MKQRIDQRGCMEALRADASHYIKIAAESRKSGCPHNVAANALLISGKIHAGLVAGSVQHPDLRVRNGAETTCDSAKLSGNVVGAFFPGFLSQFGGKVASNRWRQHQLLAGSGEYKSKANVPTN